MTKKKPAAPPPPPPTQATGTVEWVPEKGGRYVARISLQGGRRMREEMRDSDGSFKFTDKENDREDAKRCAAELSNAFRTKSLLPEQFRSSTTVEEFGEQWTSGELFRIYGNVQKLKVKRSVGDDIRRLKHHVLPHLGKMSIAAVTTKDVMLAFAAAWKAYEEKHGQPPSQGTMIQVYAVTRRLFELAIFPGSLRSDNPVTKNLRPTKGKAKLYSYLYPSELLALLRCEDIPVERRVYYALASYTGLRKGSIPVDAKAREVDQEARLEHFLWSSIDLKHSTILCLVNKTDTPQMFAQTDPELPGVGSLIELLRRWREFCGWPPDSSPVIKTLHCKRRAEAATLRADLISAGVTRAVLFRNTKHIQALRFHDLRATFVTWAKRAGKGDGWIMDRTGHVTESIMQRYHRAARELQDLNLNPGPFPDISLAIPELATLNVSRLGKKRA